MVGPPDHEVPNGGPLPDNWPVVPRRPSLVKRAMGAVRSRVGAAIEPLLLPEDHPPRGLFERMISVTPPWLVSLVVHLSLMIGLGLIVLQANSRKDETITVEMSNDDNAADDEIYAETLGEQLETPTAIASNQGAADQTVAVGSSDLPSVEDPLASLPLHDVTSDGTMPSADLPTTAIG